MTGEQGGNNFPFSDVRFDTSLNLAESQKAINAAGYRLLEHLNEQEAPEAGVFKSLFERLRDVSHSDSAYSIALITHRLDEIRAGEEDPAMGYHLKRLASFGNAVDAIATAQVFGMVGTPNDMLIEKAEEIVRMADVSDESRTELQACVGELAAGGRSGR